MQKNTHTHTFYKNASQTKDAMRPLPDCFVGTAAFRFAALTNDAFNKAFREMGGKVFCSISQQNDRLFYEFVNFDCCSRSLRTICMGRAGQNHVPRMY